MEGGTVPMVFFTVLGFVQCALWLIGKDRARLVLGLTFLFGGAMAKFEGFIFLALVGGWMLLLPSARPSLKSSPRLWPVLAFCFLAALPYLCLRVQIPSLHYESGWAGYALHHPGRTLSNWPGIFMILIARLFVSPNLASWSGEGGRLHWTGRWDGLSSLYNHPTLGLAWFCLFMAVMLWFAVPARRQVIVWILAMLVGALAAFSGVFASFVNITSLVQVVSYTANDVAGRYLLPVSLAWFATMMTVFFAETPSTISISSPGAQPSVAPAGRHRKNRAGKQRRLN
jgi:4-amino-4-deoxy-L-arabinose transferase-like glycosyltransferase